MNSDPLSPNADPPGFGAVYGNEAGDAPHAACYVQAAPLLAVMQEQVDYLISHLTSHEGNQCSSGCPDCARLEEVRLSLLKPFV
jgi:hypothetical protein